MLVYASLQFNESRQVLSVMMEHGSKWEFNKYVVKAANENNIFLFFSLYFTSANGEYNPEMYSLEADYLNSANFDNGWDFHEYTMITTRKLYPISIIISLPYFKVIIFLNNEKSSMIRFDPPNLPVTLFDWDYDKNVSSVSWDRHSLTDSPLVALLGFDDGTFKRIDTHLMLSSNDKLFTAKVAVNDIVSFSEVSGLYYPVTFFYLFSR